MDSELVLGIIATVGTDTKGVIKDITDQLAFFKYKVEEIVVSKQIISQFESDPPLFTSEYDRISHYMDLGNEIRATSDDMSILARGVARQIYLTRIPDENEKPQPKKRCAYILLTRLKTRMRLILCVRHMVMHFISLVLQATMSGG